MNSLNQTKVKALSEIYCDTHFVAGNKKELEKISSSYSPSDLTLLEVSASNIDDVIEVIRSINQLVEGVVANPHTLLEYKDLLEKREFLKKDIDSKGSEIESIRTVIKTTIEKSDIKILYPDVNDYKKFIHFINIGFKNLLEQSTEPFLLLSEIKVIKEKYELQQQLIIQNQDNRKNIEGMSKTHSISVNTTLFTRQLNSKISDFKSTVINENIDLSGYFNLSKELDLLFIFVEQFATLFNIGADAMPFGLKTVKIKLEDAFNLGRNTIVLGEAGSGKTTNLQYYADRCYRNNEDKLIVYSTLNKLASLSTAASLDPILNGLSNILEDYTGTFYSETSLDKTLKSDGAIFILDSVDEAISSYSWIVKKLALFARKYPNCQIITSSRFPVKDLKNLDFVKISLLPFDDKQKEVFFKNWFKDDIKKASFIMRHLEENPKLNKIVTNPLSATIMAILQDNKVDLPVSEYSLYQKRFELLSGVFDKHKGIIRMRNDPERLISSARKIAFEMHSQHERSLDSNLMVAFLGFKYGDEAEAIVEELISPAEILHLEADGSYTFGHLRFQEYLASEHINHARNTTPKYFYKDSWWHDTLILYSQHAEQIEWIVNSILTSESAVTFKALISNMISVRPLIERQKLTSRLEIALADERDELGNSGTFADFEPSPDEY
jgi:hypothetical protein